MAVVGAGISIPPVAIVAGFVAFPGVAIAATGGLTATGAIVGLNLVAVIAAFAAGFAHPTIPTANGFTLIGAPVAGILIAVITFFVPLKDPITAASRRAVIQAGIFLI